MPSQTPTDVSRNVPKKFPTDSYAATDPQGTSHPEPAYAAQPNQSSKPSRQHTTGLERLLHGLFLLLVMLAVLGIFVWFDIRLHKDVVSRQPIGQFQRMSGPGGLLGDVVIETEKGHRWCWRSGPPAIAASAMYPAPSASRPPTKSSSRRCRHSLYPTPLQVKPHENSLLSATQQARPEPRTRTPGQSNGGIQVKEVQGAPRTPPTGQGWTLREALLRLHPGSRHRAAHENRYER
jgi:hypothetical protein